MSRLLILLVTLVLSVNSLSDKVIGRDYLKGSAEKTSPEIHTYIGFDGNIHNIEVYRPDKKAYRGRRPCAIFFHGGGWRGGDLAQYRLLCEYLANRGMVAMTANYSMHSEESQQLLQPGESRKTICVIDGKSVIRRAKENAKELRIDPDRIVAGGASAGGHISVLAMMDSEHNNREDPVDISTDVQAFLLFCPAYTFMDQDDAPEVNVFKYVDKDFPPSLFMVGETDNWEERSSKLAKELTKRGNDIEYWMAREEGHMFFRKPDWVDVTTWKVDEFLVARGFLEAPYVDLVLPPDKKLELIEF